MTSLSSDSRVLNNWELHPFYREALVLSVDVGLSYIGVHLRLGGHILVGETAVCELAPTLTARRLARHGRRNRRSAKQRVFQLRQWCGRNGLPWPEARHDWQLVNQSVFSLRHRGMTQPGSLSPLELVACLRHITTLRGYDWHRFGEAEGIFPWGDAPIGKPEARRWIETHHLTEEIANQLRHSIPEDALDEDRAALDASIAQALSRSSRDDLTAELARHVASPRSHRMRGRNYPREVLEEHAETLIRNHAVHCAGRDLERVIAAYTKLLNYHRKDENAQKDHWEKKAGNCPFFPEMRRAKASDPDVRRFRLLEFLATRRLAVLRAKKSLFPPALRTLAADAIRALLAQLDPALPDEQHINARTLLDWLEERVCTGTEVLATLTKSVNGDYLEQLKAILRPARPSAGERAPLSVKAACQWFHYATQGGTNFDPAAFRARLATSRVAQEPSFYEQRRRAALATWFHPRVEFLLGPLAQLTGKTRDGKAFSRPADQVHGYLNQILARPEVRSALPAGHSGRPDYVIIEVVGDIPRTSDGKKKIDEAQKESRAAREALKERYGLDSSRENDFLKAILWEQQGGTKTTPARCPITGVELGTHPLAPSLHIAHIFPRAWGGPLQRDNLFLTTAIINQDLQDAPPAAHPAFRAEYVAAMRWPARKRDLFLKVWTRDEQPDWGMDTRVAQLARQLRDAMRPWLRITDENELARRVGTVSGYLTAQCRKAWLDGYTKDRADLRNHLYDAMVLAHIPPGTGLNSAAHGGIFITGGDGVRTHLTYRPPAALGPDWRAFAATHRDACLVHRHRASSSKKSRFDTTIYHVAPHVETDAKGQPEPALRLRFRKQITTGKDGWPVKDAEGWLNAAARRSKKFAAKFTPTAVARWLEDNEDRQARKAGSAIPLQAPDSAPTRAVRVDAKKAKFLNPLTQAPHDEKGVKLATETNFALALFAHTDVGGCTKVIARAVPHPRIAMLNEKWADRGITTPPSSPLPETVRILGTVKKGDTIPVRFDAAGGRTVTGEHCIWYFVAAIKSDGRAELRLVEFDESKLKRDTVGKVLGSRLPLIDIKPVITLGAPELAGFLKLEIAPVLP